MGTFHTELVGTFRTELVGTFHTELVGTFHSGKERPEISGMSKKDAPAVFYLAGASFFIYTVSILVG